MIRSTLNPHDGVEPGAKSEFEECDVRRDVAGGDRVIEGEDLAARVQRVHCQFE